MIIKMVKVQILGPKKHFYKTISTLHRLGCLHIEDVSKEPIEGAVVYKPMSPDAQTEVKRSLAEQLLTKINGFIVVSLAKDLPKYETSRETDRLYKAYSEKDFDELREATERLLQEIEQKPQQIAREKDQLEQQLAAYSRYRTIISKVKPLVEKAVKLEGFDTTAIIVDKQYRTVLDLLSDELSRITRNRFEMMIADIDKETTAALLIYPKEYSEAVHSFLWAENVTQVTLPDELSHMSYSDALALMEDKIKTLPQKIERLSKELQTYAQKYGSQLVALRDSLTDRWRELQIIESFGETNYTFVIKGWVPRKLLKRIDKGLQKEFNGLVTIDEVPITREEMEEAPVILENPSWAKPFELILNFFSLPRYGTVDPTPFLAIFYPLFFGIIIGDVGYGGVLLALAIFIGSKWKHVKALRAASYIVGFCATFAMIFGFIYDEAFGKEFWHYIGLEGFNVLGLHLPFHRAYEESTFISAYLMFAIGLGLGHLILGLVLGIINSIRERAVKHLVEKVGFLILLIGSLTIIGASMQKLPEPLATVGIMAVFISTVMIIWGGGVVGAIHILTVFGHVASYLRIMALGIAGVVLAVVAWKMQESVSNIVLGAAIALVIHSLNLVMHTFSSTIHSVRLNVLEFFDKFFEAGGKEYKPFSMKRR